MERGRVRRRDGGVEEITASYSVPPFLKVGQFDLTAEFELVKPGPIESTVAEPARNGNHHAERGWKMRSQCNTCT